jgi:hypothetical protein
MRGQGGAVYGMDCKALKPENRPFLPLHSYSHRGIQILQAVFIYSTALRGIQAKFVEVAPEILVRIF